MLVNSTRHSIFCLHLYTNSLSNTYLRMGQDHSVGNQWWACRQISYEHGVFLVSISVRLELSVEHFSFVSQTSIDSSAWNYTCMYSHTYMDHTLHAIHPSLSVGNGRSFESIHSWKWPSQIPHWNKVLYITIGVATMVHRGHSFPTSVWLGGGITEPILQTEFMLYCVVKYVVMWRLVFILI